MSDLYIDEIKKLATGYDYEDVETFIEETPNGTKKKIVKCKRHIPPNLQAIALLRKLEKETGD